MRYDNDHWWSWGLNDAKERQYDMFTEPGWDADDAVAFLDEDRSHWVNQDLKWVGLDEADDLRYQLYGESVLCYCGCGTQFPQVGGDYDRWEFDAGQSHLDWLYGN